CVNGQCQQCRIDDHCAAGQQCNDGRCDPIPGYCTSNADCPEGQECLANRCTAIAGYCNSSDDCALDETCENNRCTAKPEPEPQAQAPQCELDPVYFAFDSSELSGDARRTLQSDEACIEDRDISDVQIVGHTDPRGTEAYNLA